MIGSLPAALQLRYLQTLTEIAVEKNSTIVFMLPMDLVAPLMQIMQRQAEGSVSKPLNGSYRQKHTLPLSTCSSYEQHGQLRRAVGGARDCLCTSCH